MFVDRVSRGIGGLLILSAITFFSLSVDHISRIVLVLVAGWLALTFLLKREYVKAFRLSLSRRDIDIDALTADVQDQQSVLVLRQFLTGSDEKQTLYALELLAGTGDLTLVEPVSRLTTHTSAAVRKAALRLLAGYSSPPRLDNLTELTCDPHPEVSAEALGLVSKIDLPRGREEIEKVLQSGDAARIHTVLSRMEDNPDILGNILDKCYYIVVSYLLYLYYALRINFSLFRYGLNRAFRYLTQFSESFASKYLYFEHLFEPVLVGPDRGHFGA